MGTIVFISRSELLRLLGLFFLISARVLNKISPVVEMTKEVQSLTVFSLIQPLISFSPASVRSVY
jgi:hypothetical protein